MSSGHDDFEEQIEKIYSMISEQNVNQTRENDMWTMIEHFIKELEINREYEKTLQKSLKLCLGDDNANVTRKYTELKEKYEKIQKEYMALDAHKDELLMEIANLKDQIQKEKILYEEKEKEHCNQLQLYQASAALQCDEVESNLKRQLVDANGKLRQSQNTVRNLQMELSDVKKQLFNQRTPSTQGHTKFDLRYQPLPLSTASLSGDETEEVRFTETPPVKGVPQFVFKGIDTPRRKNTVPPLKQCTSAGTINKSKGPQRKRKLYNPDEGFYVEGAGLEEK